MRRVRLATGPTVACYEGGDPSGTPVLLLHGYADSHRFWEPVLPHLADDLRVLAVTQRGHGDSDKPMVGYDLPTLAEDVAAFLDVVDVPRAVLVGHSSGGLVAQHVAVSHPEHVAGLVLVGAPRDLQGVTAPFAEVVATMVDPVAPEAVRAVMGSLGGRLVVHDDWLEEMVHESAKVPARVWRDALAALTAAEAPTAGGAPAVPTVVMWGEDDRVLSRTGQEQLARVWGAELAVIPAGGHLLAWEQPAHVAGEINRFMGSQSADTTADGAH
jgi:rifampin ADP-ribosylating transferase